ncbi:ABC-three component system middle component 6 [Paenibacillus larvae]
MHLLDVKFSKIQRGTIMLLHNDIKPESSIYYYASMVLKVIEQNKEKEIVILYQMVKQQFDISLRVFSYCLDWLYWTGYTKLDRKIKG